MDDSYCLLPERISEQFSEIDSDIVMDLAAASPEYAELKAQMEELKRRNPAIGALLEGKGELSFTACICVPIIWNGNTSTFGAMQTGLLI